MATQLQSPITGAIEQASQRLFQTLLAGKDRELQMRRIKNEEEGLSLERDRTEAQNRANALNTAVTISHILPPGASPADYPAVIPIFREAFPDMPVDEFASFAQIPWNRKTLQDALDQGAQDILSKLPENDPLRERIFHNMTIGKAVTGAQLGAEEKSDLLRGDQAEVLSQGLAAVRKNPEFVKNAIRVGMGLSEEFEIPSFPGVKFPNSTAASIYAQLAMHQDEMGLQREKLSAESTKDLSDEIMKLGEKVDAPLGRAAAADILSSYDESARGNFKEGESPLDKLYARSNPGMQRVIKAFIGAVDVGEDAWINSQPEGVQNYFRLGRSLSKFMDKSEVPEAMKTIIKDGNVPGLGIGGPFWNRGVRFKFETPAPVEGSQLNEQQLQLLGQDLLAGIPEATIIAGAKEHGITLDAQTIARARAAVQATTRSADPTIQEAPAPGASGSAPANAAGAQGAPQLNMEDPVVKQLTSRIEATQPQIQELETRIAEAQRILSKPPAEMRKLLGGRQTGQPYPEATLRRQLANDQRRLQLLKDSVTTMEKVRAKPRGDTVR